MGYFPPGIALDGSSLEDVVLVTKIGTENLTRSLPSEPHELERMTGAD